MSRHLDASRFPRAAAYLDSLADDLSTHPDALGRADIYADIKENHPALIEEPSLSDELREELGRDWPEDGWIPDVTGVTLLCMARDRLCRSDDEFSNWNAERLSSIFRTRWYRALMYVMSPTLVFMGTSKRWGAMHRGSEFTSKGNAKACEGQLTFPPHLFPETFVFSLCSGIKVALAAAGAKDIAIEMVEFSATHALYRGRWQ